MVVVAASVSMTISLLPANDSVLAVPGNVRLTLLPAPLTRELTADEPTWPLLNVRELVSR